MYSQNAFMDLSGTNVIVILTLSKHTHTAADCRSSHLLIGLSTSLKTFVSCHLSVCLGPPPPPSIPVSPYNALIRLQHLLMTGTPFLHILTQTHTHAHTDRRNTAGCGSDSSRQHRSVLSARYHTSSAYE